jgi:hypothetical protein
MMSLSRRLPVSAAGAVLAVAAVLGSASAAQATGYSGDSEPQLLSMCLSHGSVQESYDGIDIPVPTEQVQQGSSGDCVALAQKLLTWSGYESLAVDGSFGPLTESAARGFQQTMANEGRSWCGPVDGTVGPRTFYCLMDQN